MLNDNCVNPGDDLWVKVVLDNLGDVDYEEMKITLSSDVLDMYVQSDTFDLDDGDDIAFVISAPVPLYTPSGTYDLRVIIGDEVDVHRVIYRDFIVSKQSCQAVCTEGVCL